MKIETQEINETTLAAAYHNRDVELCGLLTHLSDKYGHCMTPDELKRIDELVGEA